MFSAHCSSCAQWVKADAAERRVIIPSGAALIVPFVSVIGIPYFFFRTYPIRKAAIRKAAIATTLAFYYLCVAAYAKWAGQWMVYWVVR